MRAGFCVGALVTFLCATGCGSSGANGGSPVRVVPPTPTPVAPDYCRMVKPSLHGSPLPTTLQYRAYTGQFDTVRLFWPPHPGPASTVVVYAHGGGLTSKGDPYVDAAGVLAATSNVVSVYPSYRIGVRQNPIEVVAAAEDIGCSVAWTERYLPALVPSLDVGHVIVAGYSAGGALAAMIGVDPAWVIAAGGSMTDIAAIAAMSGRYPFDIVPYTVGSTPDSWIALYDESVSPYVRASHTAFPWLLTYEQADADAMYGDFELLHVRLARDEKNVVYGYENQHSGPHGQGDHDLANPQTAFYQEFVHFVRRDGQVTQTTGAETMPLNCRGLSQSEVHCGAQDVAVGGDGSIWIVENPKGSPTAGDQLAAKYSNPGNAQNANTDGWGFYHDLASGPRHRIAGVRIGVDGDGTPWVANAGGQLYVAPKSNRWPEWVVGSLNSAGWVAVPLPYGVRAVDVSGGGMPGSAVLWIAGSDGKLYRYDYSAADFVAEQAPNSTAVAVRIAVDSQGTVYLVDAAHRFYRRVGPASWATGSGEPLIDVGAGNGVFGVGVDHRVYPILADRTQPALAAAGTGYDVAVSAAGQPVVVTMDWQLLQVH